MARRLGRGIVSGGLVVVGFAGGLGGRERASREERSALSQAE